MVLLWILLVVCGMTLSLVITGVMGLTEFILMIMFMDDILAGIGLIYVIKKFVAYTKKQKNAGKST